MYLYFLAKDTRHITSFLPFLSFLVQKKKEEKRVGGKNFLPLCHTYVVDENPPRIINNYTYAPCLPESAHIIKARDAEISKREPRRRAVYRGEFISEYIHTSRAVPVSPLRRKLRRGAL